MIDVVFFIVLALFIALMLAVIVGDDGNDYDDPNLTNEQKDDMYYHQYF